MKEYAIVIKEVDVVMKVSKRTYYKIFNNEIGRLTERGYEINLNALKKYKKLYNSLRGVK